METADELVLTTHTPSPPGWLSIEEWLLDVLQQRGMQTLDQLGLLLPADHWAQLLLALDRLSRSGRIVLWSNGQGEYLAKVKDPYLPAWSSQHA